MHRARQRKDASSQRAVWPLGSGSKVNQEKVWGGADGRDSSGLDSQQASCRVVASRLGLGVKGQRPGRGQRSTRKDHLFAAEFRGQGTLGSAEQASSNPSREWGSKVALSILQKVLLCLSGGGQRSPCRALGSQGWEVAGFSTGQLPFSSVHPGGQRRRNS